MKSPGCDRLNLNTNTDCHRDDAHGQTLKTLIICAIARTPASAELINRAPTLLATSKQHGLNGLEATLACRHTKLLAAPEPSAPSLVGRQPVATERTVDGEAVAGTVLDSWHAPSVAGRHHQRQLCAQLSCPSEGQTLQVEAGQMQAPKARAMVDIAQHLDGPYGAELPGTGIAL